MSVPTTLHRNQSPLALTRYPWSESNAVWGHSSPVSRSAFRWRTWRSQDTLFPHIVTRLLQPRSQSSRFHPRHTLEGLSYRVPLLDPKPHCDAAMPQRDGGAVLAPNPWFLIQRKHAEKGLANISQLPFRRESTRDHGVDCSVCSFEPHVFSKIEADSTSRVNKTPSNICERDTHQFV